MKKIILAVLLGVIMLTISSFSKKTIVENCNSISFTVNPTDWKPVGKSGKPGCYMTYRYNSNALTQNTFDNGAIMVYVLGTSGGGWYPLPHAYYTSKVLVTTTFDYQTGYVELRTYSAKNKLAPLGTSLRYKLVIIPG